MPNQMTSFTKFRPEKNKSPTLSRSHFTNFDNLVKHKQNLHTGKYKVHVPGCECDRIKKIKKLRLLTENDSPDIDLDESLFDGLTVVPDGKNVLGTFYMCPNTSAFCFEANHLECEAVLREAVFEVEHSFKISFAQCGLTSVPNAMAIIASKDRGLLESLRTAACDRKAAAAENSLKHDHCDLLFILSFDKLVTLANSKTRSQRKAVLNNVALEMKLPPPVDDEKIAKLKIAYHLETALVRLRELVKNMSGGFIVVMGRVSSGDGGWELDLPGGKRHIGESAECCVERELYEETSIKLAEDCEWGGRMSERDASKQNCFYFLFPRGDGGGGEGEERNLDPLLDFLTIDTNDTNDVPVESIRLELEQAKIK